MFRSYFIIAFRNLLRNKIFSFINISGLALGIAAFIFIQQYVSFEYSYNRFHKQLPHLYRMLLEADLNGKKSTWPFVSPGIGPLVKEKFKEIKNYCRVAEGITSLAVISFSNEKDKNFRSFRENGLTYADASLFELFTFPVLEGEVSELQKPNKVVISQSTKIKYFGRQNALGKTLTLYNQFGKTTYQIAAVYKDFPAYSNLQFKIIFSLKTLEISANLKNNTWAKLDNLDINYLNTYFLIQDGSDIKALENKMNEAKKKIRPASTEIVRLQAMRNIHLASSLNDYYDTFGSLPFVYLLSGVGLMILLIAWFNYINLSTATSMKRAKEVSIRKVIGARRWQLVQQFLGESLMLNFAGFFLAILVVEITQGWFNQLTGKELQLGIILNHWFWLSGLFLLIFGALLSGAYSSWVLTSFRPVLCLKGVFLRSARGVRLRQALVVFQFVISIALISATLIIYRQVNYMQTKNLGIDPKKMIVIRGADIGRDSTINQKNTAFLNEIAKLPFVEKYSCSGAVPTQWYNFNTGGITRLQPQPGDERKSYSIAIIDHRYFDTYQIKFLAGKNFTSEQCTREWGKVDQLIVNEKAALLLGFSQPLQALGQKIRWADQNYEIRAIVKDYHHQAANSNIDPLVFFPQINPNYYSLKIHTSDLSGKIKIIEQAFHKLFPNDPFEYFFSDEKFNAQFSNERQFAGIFTLSSFLAILIACLGLFGLASFAILQRAKEIGIRKVLGASLQALLILLTKDFLKPVFVAIALAIPLTWYFIRQWLESFPYRIEIGWFSFLVAGISAVVIALITIIFQALRAGLANPVESLRNE